MPIKNKHVIKWLHVFVITCIIFFSFVGIANAYLATTISAIATAIGGLAGTGIVASAITAVVKIGLYYGLNKAVSKALAPDVPGIGNRSNTYAYDTPISTIAQGTPVSKAYGICQLPGNVIRQNDIVNEASIQCLVDYGAGEWDAFLTHYFNGEDWSIYEEESVQNNVNVYLGTDDQTIYLSAFEDNDNYRGDVIAAYSVNTVNRAKSLDNVYAIARTSKCLEIGQNIGGTESFTSNQAQILWDLYLKEKNADYTTEMLPAVNAWESLYEYCQKSLCHLDSNYYPVNVFSPSGDLVKETSVYKKRYAKYIVNPNIPPIGASDAESSWTASANANQRVNLDFGRKIVLTRMELSNYHDEGGYTTEGIKDFVIQGSNSSTAFDDVSYAASGWTNVQTGLQATKHTAVDQAEWETFDLTTNVTGYRYYSIRVSTNWGGGERMGIRQVRFFTGNAPSECSDDESNIRYSFNYNFDTKIELNDAEKIIWQSFNGKVLYSQGIFKPVWDGAEEADGAGSLQNKSVVHNFDVSTNVVAGSFSWWRLDKPNVYIVNYLDGANQFKKDSVIIKDTADIAIRGEITFEENCWYIVERQQAIRRCKNKYNKSYVDVGCQLTGFPDSQNVEEYDRVTISDDEAGWSSKDFIVIKKDEDQYGRSVFALEAYLSGVYGDEGFEDQPSYASRPGSPAQSPPSIDSDTVTVTNVSASAANSYSLGSIRVQFTPPTNNPGYSETLIWVSTTDNDNEYYLADRDSKGDVYVNGLGVFWDYGDTVYVRLQNANAVGLTSVFPTSYDGYVVIDATTKLAGFYAGQNDFWSGNEDIANVATTVVLNSSEPKFAMGAYADSLAIDNIATYPGFYAEGTNGYFRAGTANKYIVWDSEIEIKAGGLYLNSATEIFALGSGIFLDGANETIEIGDVSVDGILFDTSNGQRMYDGGTLKGQWALDSAWWLGPNSTNKKVEWNPTDDTFYIRGNAAFDTMIFQEVMTTKGTIQVAKSGGELFEGVTADSPIFTIKVTKSPSGGAPFANGDRCLIDNGINQTWFIVGTGADWTYYWEYTATYNSGSSTATYSAGTAITDYGQNGDGGILISADMSNAPWISVFKHSGIPWSDMEYLVKMGNLNGYAGYSSDIYGFASYIDADNYITIDPTDGIQMSGSIAITSFNRLPSDEDLKGYWSFDDGTGATAVDNSGNGYDLTLYNTPLWVSGISGNGIDVNGSNQYGRNTSLDPPNPISISVWVNADDFNEEGYIVRYGSAIYFSLRTTGKVRFLQYNITYNELYSSATLNADEWYHIVVVYDGTTGADSQKIYINGELDNSNAADGTTYADTSADLYVGAQSGSVNRFNGTIDELRIYNKVLTASEIKALYLNPSGNKSQTVNVDSLTNGTHGIVNTAVLDSGYISIMRKSATSNQRIEVTASDVDIYQGGNKLSSWTSSSLEFYDSSANTIAHFGGYVTVGQVAASKGNIYIDASGNTYWRVNTTNYISIANDGTGSINLIAGSDLTLAGDATNPAQIIWEGSSYSVASSMSATGNLFQIAPQTSNVDCYIGSSNVFDIIGLFADNSIAFSNSGYVMTLQASPKAIVFGALHKQIDLAEASYALNNIYADDFNNVADIPFLDDRDDLKFLMEMEGSGEIDPRTGLEIINDDTLPDFVKAMDKEGKREILLDSDGKPYFTVKAMLGWHNGCIRQLVNEFRTHMKEYH